MTSSSTRTGADPRRGYLLVAGGAGLFVLNAGISRAIQAAGIESTTLTTVRCTGTAIALVAIVLIRGERLHLPRGWREWATVLAFGVVGLALVQYFYFVAIDRLPVGLALLLEYTAPVLVALFAWAVYREKMRRRVWLGIACALGGLALVAEVRSGMSLDPVGVLAGLGASVSLATYFLVGEHSVSTEPPLHVLTEAAIVAAVFWNLIAPVTRLSDTDLTTPVSLGGNLSAYELPLWFLFGWLVVVGTVVPYLAYLMALKHLSATEVTLLGMLEPIGATVLGWLWFDEILSVLQVVGVAAMLVGIGLAQTARVAAPAEQPPFVH